MPTKSESVSAAISLPKGGGAIQGIGETFRHNSFSGTAAWTVPIPVTPGRSGFGPELALTYDSGSGNGVFGLGWNLTLPRITRKTDLGLPRYDGTDAFVMSGTEELVPQIAPDGSTRSVNRGEFVCELFRPRLEGTFARIERWTHIATGAVHWRATTRDNITSIYGRTTSAQIIDPDHPERIFAWLIEESFDARGNHILYEYAGDDPDLRLPEIYEDQRLYGQRYLRRILYGNLPDGVTDAGGAPVGVARLGVDHADPLKTRSRRYVLEIVFDYGGATPGPAPAQAALEIFGATDPPRRLDAFSTCRPGWELRTLRRCERVLMYHRFPELSGPTLVRSTRLHYHTDPETGLSLLESVTVAGHKPNDTRDLTTEMPPLTFRYEAFRPREQHFRSLSARGLGLPAEPLSARDLALVDLFGDGAPDFLQSGPAGWRYWKNLGDGEFDEPRPLPATPAGLSLDGPGVALADVDGDGCPELVLNGNGISGFFRAGDQGPFSLFQPFPAAVPFDPADPQLRFVDLTGDGRADALLLSRRQLYWFENRGPEGYGPAVVLPRLSDLDDFPDLSFDDPSGRLHLADINGDGLVDIVLVHQGRVDYWPNQGYGRFGPRITMAGLPSPPGLSPTFDPRRLLLTDLNGSGCADLIYLDFHRLHIWFNQSGNGWSDPVTIDGTPQAVTPETVRAADVFGTGTATLVWSYNFGLFPGSHYQAIDLCGGAKPFLLQEMVNGLGAVTRLTYASSTSFALTDAASGTPWVTRLPFPVQVVEGIETIDQVGQTRLVSRFSYHHGYFDAAEREFRGFARVERLDTEHFASFAAGATAAPANANQEQHVPPVRTITWHHTGAYFEVGDALSRRLALEYYSGDTQAPVLPDHEVDLTDAPAEAHRALKGAVIRSEIYALDDSPRAPHPFTVESHRFKVQALQPPGDGRRGVFLRTPRESLSLRYERDPDDPRTAHTLNLSVDAFGNITRSLAAAYPRRGHPTEPEQQLALAALTANRFINTPEIAPAAAFHYYIGVPCETRQYEIPGAESLIPAGGLFTPASLSPLLADLDDFVPLETDPPPGNKRLLNWTRTYFKQDQQAAGLPPPDRTDGRLPLGTIEPLGLPFETCQAVLTPGLLANLYGTEIGAADLVAAGYVNSAALDADLPARAAGLQWLSGGRQATEADRFHLPTRTQDSFGAVSRLEYDRYGFGLLRTLDPLGNDIRVREFDYRLLQPRTVSDPNGNPASVAVDALGLVIATAVAGKNGEGDTLAGLEPDLGAAEIDAFFADPVTQAPILLGSATTRVVYDLHRQRSGSGPARAATISRQVHASEPGAGTIPVQIAILYSDGYGRSIQTKILTEPGEVSGVSVPRRWITSGWVINNNKGKPVQQFEPFFSATHDFEFAPLKGVTNTVFYDPFGRPVATLQPDGCYEKRLPGPWDEVAWDSNDTIRLQPHSDPDVAGYVARFVAARPGFQTWLQRRLPDPDNPPSADTRTPEQDAAVKALAYAGTPVVQRLDPLGRIFLTLQDLGSRQLAVRETLDVLGQTRRLNDPRGLITLAQVFDMTGRILRLDGPDAGRRTLFLAADAKPVLTIDANGNRVRTSYDVLRRVLEVRVSPPAGSTFIASRAVYGESLGPTASAANHRTRPHQIFDGVGSVTHTAYDFKGNLLASTRKFFPEHRRLPDWATDAIPPGTREFSTLRDYDALNRPVVTRTPDNSRTLRRFNRSGQLSSVQVHKQGNSSALQVLQTVDYDARGQRTRTSLGNGVILHYDYDPETFRVNRIQALRGSTRLQDVTYTYDPVGNVSRCADGAFATVFNGNQRLDPVSTYTYDALYRLIEASGREHEALGVCAHDQDWRVNSPCSGGSKQSVFINLTPQPVNNGQALRNYRETYRYDDAGNLQEIRHLAGPRGSWTRTQTFAPDSNRLTLTDAGCPRETGFTVAHDANGNLTALPHVRELHWDHANQLIQVTLAGATGDAAFYTYDGTGQRSRKVLERAGTPTCTRFYTGEFELFLDQAPGADPPERQTLHVLDGADRLAVLEAWTEGGRQESRVRYQLSDHLGSSLLELDAAGQVISYEEYRPYGDTAYLAGTSFTEVQRKRYRYSGKERDDETGLYYFGARFYASWLGRWLSCDPAGVKGGLNLYARGRSNPVTYADRTGMADREPICPVTQTPLDPENVSGSGIQAEGYKKFFTDKSSEYKGQQTRLIKTTYLPQKGGAEGAVYPMQVTEPSEVFLGTGSGEMVSTPKELGSNNLLAKQWGEGFEYLNRKHNMELRGFSMEIVETRTVNALARVQGGAAEKGAAFLDTKIGGDLNRAAGQVGLEIDPASVRVYDYKITGKFRPLASPGAGGGGPLVPEIATPAGETLARGTRAGPALKVGGGIILALAVGSLANTPVSQTETGELNIALEDPIYGVHNADAIDRELAYHFGNGPKPPWMSAELMDQPDPTFMIGTGVGLGGVVGGPAGAIIGGLVGLNLYLYTAYR